MAGAASLLAARRSARLGRMKRMVSLAPALAVMLVVAACSKDGASKDALPEVPPESVPVLAMVELPSGRSLGSAAAVIDAVQPGASAQAADAIPSMLISAVGVSSLDGADLDKPVRAVVLDPKKHPQPVVLLVTVKDASALAQAVTKEKLVVRNELGLIGAPEAIKAAHDYAFGTLARRETPGGPYAVAYMAPILTSFRAEIDAGKMQLGALMTMMSGGTGGDMLGKMLALYIDGIVTMAEQTDRIEARFAGQDALSGVDLTMHARPDTTFAGFCKAQEADDFELVTMLPAHEAPPLVMAGRMALGPARKPFVAFGEAVIAAMWSDAINEETRGMIDPWLDLFTGRFAAEVTAISATPEMVQLIELNGRRQGRGLQPAVHDRADRQGRNHGGDGHEADDHVHARGVHARRRGRDGAEGRYRVAGADRPGCRCGGARGGAAGHEHELLRGRG